MTFIVRPRSLRMVTGEEHGEDCGEPREPPRHWPKIHRRVFRGDTILIPLVIVDEWTRQPIDVTGWTFWFTAKFAVPNPDAQAAIAQDNISPGGNGGITLVAPTGGQVLVTVQPLVTRSYPDGDVFLAYDVQAEDTSSVITTVEVGTMVVVPDITRAIVG